MTRRRHPAPSAGVIRGVRLHGSPAARAPRADGVSVTRRATRRGRAWGDTDAITRLLDGADLLVNLAGRSVNCRYTPANRAEILRSRMETTEELARAAAAAYAPPRSGSTLDGHDLPARG